MERTDADRFAIPPRPLAVTLGGRAFEIAIQKHGQTAAWRSQLEGLLPSVQELQALLTTVAAAVGEEEVQLGALPLDRLAALAHGLLVRGANELLGLVFAYDPDFSRENKSWIEANVYEEELIGVLVELFRVVYGPFLGPLTKGIKTAAGLTDAEETEETETETAETAAA